MHESGIMIGHFEPLHLGQLRSILYAAGMAQQLHVVITPHPAQNPRFPVTLQDKARWMQMACADLPFIKVHTLNDFHLPFYDDFGNVTLDINRSNAKLNHAIQTLGLPEDSVLFVAENNPCALPENADKMSATVVTTPLVSDYHSYSIHQDPVAHWHAIHPEARGDYTRTVAIVGGESSGKTTLVHKLANYYGANFALEMGRLYVGTDLGGTEVGLQYSDYAPIVLDHAEAIRAAKHRAPSPVTIVDTDFVTTQAFCEEYEGRTHPFVTACIEEFRLDHTIMLDNNTPWVADGMRSLGSDNARDRFENRLVKIFDRHGITPHHITDADYHERYLAAIAFINEAVFGQG